MANPGELRPEDQLTEYEKRFVRRIVSKFEDTRLPLARSLAVISLLILIAHGIVRSPLPHWVSLLIIYIPTLWVFSRYRRFAIFKSRILRKLAMIAPLGDAPDKKPPG